MRPSAYSSVETRKPAKGTLWTGFTGALLLFVSSNIVGITSVYTSARGLGRSSSWSEPYCCITGGQESRPTSCLLAMALRPKWFPFGLLDFESASQILINRICLCSGLPSVDNLDCALAFT
jgi:hypothetical protein